MALTQEQLDFFQRDGFLSYGPILTEEHVALLREEYDREIEKARKEETGRVLRATDSSGNLIEADKQQVYQIMQLGERNMQFRRLWYESAILDVVADLIGPNIQLYHDQALFKPPHTGGPVPWHQDNAYWKCRPANLVSCWLTLDDVRRENGAMQLIPGSHLAPADFTNHAEDHKDALFEIEGVDESKAVVVDLLAGGCLFHHCQTFHSTQPNTTEDQRRAFAIHFMVPGTVRGDGEAMPISFQRPLLRASFS